MNSPFVINEVKKCYVLTWPTFHDIRGNEGCYKLLELLFEKIKVNEAQLILDKDQYVTINASLWYGNYGDRYSEWLMSQYNILGVIFKEKSHAEYLQDYLEKKYIWRLLKM